MNNESIKKTIRKEIEKVLNNLGIELKEIILFGSRAREDYKEHSDWDIFIVLNEEIDLQKKKKFGIQFIKNYIRSFLFLLLI